MEYNNNNNFKNYSLAIKESIVSGIEGATKQGTTLLKNPSFYSNIARQLSLAYIPFIGSKKQEFDKAGNDVSLIISNEDNITESGYFKNVDIVPNVQLVSKFTQRNFFDSSLNIESVITIDIPVCTISVNYSNTFVESSPIGYQGSIKEDVGSSNYEVMIQGVFVARYIGDSVLIPEQNQPDLKDFITMCVRNKSVQVNHSYFINKTLIDLSDCVIKSFSLPNDNAMKNVQQFTLTLSSDKLIDIQ